MEILILYMRKTGPREETVRQAKEMGYEGELRTPKKG